MILHDEFSLRPDLHWNGWLLIPLRQGIRVGL